MIKAQDIINNADKNFKYLTKYYNSIDNTYYAVLHESMPKRSKDKYKNYALYIGSSKLLPIKNIDFGNKDFFEKTPFKIISTGLYTTKSGKRAFAYKIEKIKSFDKTKSVISVYYVIEGEADICTCDVEDNVHYINDCNSIEKFGE